MTQTDIEIEAFAASQDYAINGEAAQKALRQAYYEGFIKGARWVTDTQRKEIEEYFNGIRKRIEL